MNSFFHILGLTLLTTLPTRRESGQGCPPLDYDSRPLRAKSSWVVLKTSTLEITGNTNINHFTCGVPQYTEADTLSFLPDGARSQATGIPLTGTLRLDIDQFDCRNRVMTGEFKKALKYRRYPQLTIHFVSLEKMPCFNSQPETIKGQVEIRLAGITRNFEILYTARGTDHCAVELTGTRQLTFQDFGLTPPRKMGGLIKVSDNLHVRFTLCLRQVE